MSTRIERPAPAPHAKRTWLARLVGIGVIGTAVSMAVARGWVARSSSPRAAAWREVQHGRYQHEGGEDAASAAACANVRTLRRYASYRAVLVRACAAWHL